jgi:hypothetical protein
MSARGHFIGRDAMLCVRRAMWMFGLALAMLSAAPSPGQELENPGLAYVVSPPPATRQLMPNYLPRLPPETTARSPHLATHSARRLRTSCRHCHVRHHVRRCVHCRHRIENLGASRRCRRADHCTHHRRGHSEHRRRRLPRHHRALDAIDRRLVEPSGLRRRSDPGFSLTRGTAAARLTERRRKLLRYGTASKTSALAAANAPCGDSNIEASPRKASRCSRDRNLAAMNQQFAAIDLRKSQLSPTSAAVLCHFMSASSRTRGDADWRPGGT